MTLILENDIDFLWISIVDSKSRYVGLRTSVTAMALVFRFTSTIYLLIYLPGKVQIFYFNAAGRISSSRCIDLALFDRGKTSGNNELMNWYLSTSVTTTNQSSAIPIWRRLGERQRILAFVTAWPSPVNQPLKDVRLKCCCQCSFPFKSLVVMARGYSNCLSRNEFNFRSSS